MLPRTCPLVLLALALAAPMRVNAAGTKSPDAAPSPKIQAALRVAAKALPKVTWRPEQARVADFSYDGVPDVALLGWEGTGDDLLIAIVVVEGPITERSRVLELWLRGTGNSQDAICGSREQLELKIEIPSGGCRADARNAEAQCDEVLKVVPREALQAGAGLRLFPGGCDTFHVFFDGKELRWWRI